MLQAAIVLLIFNILPHHAIAEIPQEVTTVLVASSTPVKITNPLFEKIGWCESRNNPLAKNSHSSASGRFQFLKSSWEYYGKQLWGDEWVNKNVFDYDDNTELARYVYKKNGTADWESSRQCWDK